MKDAVYGKTYIKSTQDCVERHAYLEGPLIVPTVVVGWLGASELAIGGIETARDSGAGLLNPPWVS